MLDEHGTAIAVHVQIVLVFRTRPQQVARFIAPHGPPRGDGQDQPQRGPAGGHLQRQSTRAIGNGGGCEHDRVQDRRRHHERQARCRVHPACDQTARDRNGSALAHGEREPAERGRGELELQREAGNPLERSLGYVDGDEGRDQCAEQDERERLDDDRGEDQDEDLDTSRVARAGKATETDRPEGDGGQEERLRPRRRPAEGHIYCHRIKGTS